MFKKLVVVVGLVGFILVSNSAYAVEDEPKITEGMKQDEFAILLISELGAEKLLPPAAVVADYFALLEELGVEPVNGWDIEGVITREDLIYILGLADEEAQGLTFEELLERLMDRLADLLAIRSEVRPPVSPSAQ
jgi:hypothetical protein